MYYLCVITVTILLFPETSVAVISSLCEYDVDCVATNSYCRRYFEGCKYGLCDCLATHYSVEGNNLQCFIKPDIGDPCEEPEECRHLTGNSDCTNGRCRCDPGERQMKMGGFPYCYVSRLEENCTSHDDCAAFQEAPTRGRCDLGADIPVCECSTGYKRSGQRCVFLEHGDVCAPSGECDGSIDLYCSIDPDQATCQCPTAHSYKGAYGRCIHNQAAINRRLGEQCNEIYNDNKGRICEPHLGCGLCAGDEGEDGLTCMVPASSTRPCYNIVILLLLTFCLTMKICSN